MMQEFSASPDEVNAIIRIEGLCYALTNAAKDIAAKDGIDIEDMKRRYVLREEQIEAIKGVNDIKGAERAELLKQDSRLTHEEDAFYPFMLTLHVLANVVREVHDMRFLIDDNAKEKYAASKITLLRVYKEAQLQLPDERYQPIVDAMYELGNLKKYTLVEGKGAEYQQHDVLDNLLRRDKTLDNGYVM